MTLLDPFEFDNSQLLFVQSVDFPHVMALPERQSSPDGDVLTYRFSNGYGALVTRSEGHPLSSAFEFVVLDCTRPTPTPTYLTPVAPYLLMGLSYDQVAQLLPQTERLPTHPKLAEANSWLDRQQF